MSIHSSQQKLSSHLAKLDLLTRAKLWGFLGVMSLLLLFVPSLRLLLTSSHPDSVSMQPGWSFNGYGFLLESLDRTTELDPIGYNALLSTAFFRSESSSYFLAPTATNLLADVSAQADYKELETLTSRLGLTGRRVSQEAIEAGQEVKGLVGCQKFSPYSSDGLILALSKPEYHFVALLEAGTDYVYVFNSLTGRMIYPCPAFLDIWEGAAFAAR